MDVTSIETLFLDAGGVLVFPNWSRVSAALAARGIRVAPEQLAAAEPHAKRRFDTSTRITGSTDQQRSFPYFNMVLAAAGIEQNAATDAALEEMHHYHARLNLWEVVPDDVKPALARFRDLGLRLAVISNANGTIHACLDRVGLTPCFDAIFDSHVEGVEKPNPRLFQIACDRTGARPDTAMHVGDIYHVDVVGARNASIRPLLLDPFGLYGDADCPRVPTLGALADQLESMRPRA
jgi:HAD superfamily hydrolase (TIGR01549 family)